MAEPKPEPFVVRRPMPVAGPGIERKEEDALSPGPEEAPAPSPPVSRSTNRRQSVARKARAPRRSREVMVGLDGMMALLDMVKPEERTHLTTIVKLLNDLPASARKRVLEFVVRVFQ